GQELAERRGLPRAAVTLAAEECNSLTRAGRFEDARLVATRFGFDSLPQRPGADLRADKGLRIASRYLLQQAPVLVAQALGGAIEEALQRGLAHRAVVLLLRALAHRENDDWPPALADLQQALTIAAPRHY